MDIVHHADPTMEKLRVCQFGTIATLSEEGLHIPT